MTAETEEGSCSTGPLSSLEEPATSPGEPQDTLPAFGASAMRPGRVDPPLAPLEERPGGAAGTSPGVTTSVQVDRSIVGPIAVGPGARAEGKVQIGQYVAQQVVISSGAGSAAALNATATDATLAALREVVGMLAGHHHGEATVRLHDEELPLEPPAVVEHLSRRRKLVQHLQQKLETVTWLAVNGQVGIGKTHAGTLLAEALGRCDAWVRLRDAAEDVAAQRLNAALASLAKNGVARTRRIEEVVAHRLESGGLIVLDDIPRLGTGSAFWERLVMLAKAFAKSGAKLVTTSNHTLPTRIRELVSSSVLAEEECPLLEEDEVAEVLGALGAPDTVLSEGLSRSLPRCLTVTRYLSPLSEDTCVTATGKSMGPSSKTS